jgi:Spy/CpxP family protein refolding chaperone
MHIRFVAAFSLALLAMSVILPAQDSTQNDEARKHFFHTLGGPFIVSRANVQEELKLSDAQKQKLRAKLADFALQSMQAVTQAEHAPVAEREPLLRPIREAAYQEMWPFLQDILDTGQLKRMRQLELQHEGPAALLGRPEIAQALAITDDQRKQLIAIVQEMQRTLQSMMREIQTPSDRENVRRRATKVYEEQEQKVEAILTAAQRPRWKELYGQPFDVFNDN